MGSSHRPFAPMIAALVIVALVLTLVVAIAVRTGSLPAALRYGLPALTLVALAGLFFWHLGANDTHPPPDLTGRPVPAFVLPPLVAGQPSLKTSDLKGRVTLVNFFASWCVPCRAEHPLLAEVANSGIAVIGIAYKDTPGAAAFLAENGNPYSLVAADADERAGTAFAITGVPQSYLVDKNGVVRFQLAGPLTEAILRREILPLALSLK